MLFELIFRIFNLHVSLVGIYFGLFFISLILLLTGVLIKYNNTKKHRKQIQNSVSELYIAHFYAVWSRRMWEMSLPLVLIDLFGNTFLPIALYTMVVYSGVVLIQPYVGKWSDSTNRLKSQIFTISSENVCVIITSVSLIFLTFNESILKTHILFGIICFCGVVGELSINSSTQMLEKDWMVILALKGELNMNSINTILRRIDLSAKSLGPAVFTFIYSSFGSNPK